MSCRYGKCTNAAQGDGYCWGHKRRKPMPRSNPKRAAKMRKKRHGPQAELCKTLPCGACHKPPTPFRRIAPHHWPTVARGGEDKDTGPLCDSCHTTGGRPRAFHSTPLADWEAFHGVTMASIVEATRLRLALTLEPGDPWDALPY